MPSRGTLPCPTTPGATPSTGGTWRAPQTRWRPRRSPARRREPSGRGSPRCSSGGGRRRTTRTTRPSHRPGARGQPGRPARRGRAPEGSPAGMRPSRRSGRRPARGWARAGGFGLRAGTAREPARWRCWCTATLIDKRIDPAVSPGKPSRTWVIATFPATRCCRTIEPWTAVDRCVPSRTSSPA